MKRFTGLVLGLIVMGGMTGAIAPSAEAHRGSGRICRRVVKSQCLKGSIITTLPPFRPEPNQPPKGTGGAGTR